MYMFRAREYTCFESERMHMYRAIECTCIEPEILVQIGVDLNKLDAILLSRTCWSMYENDLCQIRSLSYKSYDNDVKIFYDIKWIWLIYLIRNGRQLDKSIA